jgi:hypothetical protein
VQFPAIVPEPGKDFQSMLLADADTGQLLLAENINKTVAYSLAGEDDGWAFGNGRSRARTSFRCKPRL